jgi:hypothetical protein
MRLSGASHPVFTIWTICRATKIPNANASCLTDIQSTDYRVLKKSGALGKHIAAKTVQYCLFDASDGKIVELSLDRRTFEILPARFFTRRCFGPRPLRERGL